MEILFYLSYIGKVVGIIFVVVGFVLLFGQIFFAPRTYDLSLKSILRCLQPFIYGMIFIFGGLFIKDFSQEYIEEYKTGQSQLHIIKSKVVAATKESVYMRDPDFKALRRIKGDVYHLYVTTEKGISLDVFQGTDSLRVAKKYMIGDTIRLFRNKLLRENPKQLMIKKRGS